MIPNRLAWMVLLIGLVSGLQLNAASSPGPLRVRERSSQTEVFLPADPVPPLAGTQYRLLLEGSSDLENWSPAGELQLSTDSQAPWLLALEGGPVGFYRLQSQIEAASESSDGAEIFGYNRVFTQKLREIGFMQLDEFSARFATNIYLPKISFDPTTASYWNEFNLDPKVVNASLPANSPERRLHDFRMRPGEFARFQTNGFVVSERLGSYSFADVFYLIFTDDLPVFISADSVLHAWHWSFQAMLSEIEETQLTWALQQALDQMAGPLSAVADVVGTGPLRESVLDADYFVAVARSLLRGAPVASALGQQSRVSETLSAIASAQYEPEFPLWGRPRRFDFSQFQVRGHYARTEALRRYFQAIKWLGLADMRIASTNDPIRELGTAVVLNELNIRASAGRHWQSIDEIVRTFVGPAEALSFRELGPLRSVGLWTLQAANQPGRLEQIQVDLFNGHYGVTSYANAAYPTPFGVEQTQLPRLFSVLGPRFILDGWATAQVTFDRILWNEDLPDGRTFMRKVVRRLPTGLDVAFGVLGNRQVSPEIREEILNSGLPHQHNLVAVKATVDEISSATWDESIYTRWLYALRMLSVPTTDPAYPEAMRTRAWAHKTLNTQLASWTQLRHDTVLYAAQPYTSIILCEYPTGYVEPRVEFWEAMRSLAKSTADMLGKYPSTGLLRVPLLNGGFTNINLYFRHMARVQHCENFATEMDRLRELSVKELGQVPFSDEDISHIRSTMNSQEHPYYGKSFDGWYPLLFYKDYGQVLPGNIDTNASDRRDALVTDVHSAPPDVTGFPGGVLHEAVGDVDLLLIAIECESGSTMYAGPTLSHYEFIEPGLTRLNDHHWQDRLRNWPEQPIRPPWTTDYLVPKR